MQAAPATAAWLAAAHARRADATDLRGTPTGTVRMISQRVQSMLRMTMADMADAADALDGAFRLENADTYLTPPAHVLRGDARGRRRRRLQQLPAAARAAGAAGGDRGAVRGGSGLAYDPEGEIVVSCGAGESLLNALLTLIDPGDKVLLTEPDLQRDGAARAARGRGAGLHAARPSWRPLEPRPRASARRREGCRVLFFASPCMPVGTVFTRRGDRGDRGGGGRERRLDRLQRARRQGRRSTVAGSRCRGRASARSSSAACRRTT